MTTKQLTPKSDKTPVVATIPEPELSGADWVNHFLGSNLTRDLQGDFKTNVESFINALKDAGATVSIAATFRPPERAYLMRGCWDIVHKKVKPKDVKAMKGVNIKWDHGEDKKSLEAAKAMASGYGIQNLKVAPALQSRHTEGSAIDMSITWLGNLIIRNAKGQDVTINTQPRDGMNAMLAAVGATYEVIKYKGGANDKPHWSTDGK